MKLRINSKYRFPKRTIDPYREPASKELIVKDPLTEAIDEYKSLAESMDKSVRWFAEKIRNILYFHNNTFMVSADIVVNPKFKFCCFPYRHKYIIGYSKNAHDFYIQVPDCHKGNFIWLNEMLNWPSNYDYSVWFVFYTNLVDLIHKLNETLEIKALEDLF